MIESFFEVWRLFPNALISGITITVVCGIIGVFVVLKRVVFIGVALSETAACGIAAAMLLRLPPLLGAATLTLLAVWLLSVQYEASRIPRDAVLGVLFLLAASVSILLVSKSGFGLHEIKVMLYGDLILSGKQDRTILLLTNIPAGVLFLLFIRPITYTFLDRDASQVMGISCRFWDTLFFLLLGLIVSSASTNGGVLLAFCYLVVIPSIAMLLTKSLTRIIILSPLLGIVATLSGLTLSYHEDIPCNQTIIAISCTLFGILLIICRLAGFLNRINYGSLLPKKPQA